jgi:hypothetical protein
MLSRRFKPPAKSDLAGWRKVEYLVHHGFYFQSFGFARYPKTLAEAREFVKKYKQHAMRRP